MYSDHSLVLRRPRPTTAALAAVGVIAGSVVAATPASADQQSTQHSQLTASTLSTMTAQSTMVLSKVVIAERVAAVLQDLVVATGSRPPRSLRDTASSLTPVGAPSRLDGRSS